VRGPSTDPKTIWEEEALCDHLGVICERAEAFASTILHVGVTNQPQGIVKTFFILCYSRALCLHHLLKLPNFGGERIIMAPARRI